MTGTIGTVEAIDRVGQASAKGRKCRVDVVERDLRVLGELAAGERLVRDIAWDTGMGVRRVQRSLCRLRALGLVVMEEAALHLGRGRMVEHIGRVASDARRLVRMGRDRRAWGRGKRRRRV